MSNGSHAHRMTFIGFCRKVCLGLKHRHQWSNETTFEYFVDAHERIDGPAVTGIAFESKSVDAFTRMRANGQRWFRWLDDESKEKNLLPANMLPTFLAGLPSAECAEVLEFLANPRGFSVRAITLAADAPLDALSMLRSVTTEAADAQQALIDCADGATSAELDRAAKELRELLQIAQESLDRVDRARINRQLVVVK